MSKPKFPFTVTERGVSARIRKAQQIKDGRRYTLFVVDYHLLGKHKQETRSSFEEAKQVGATISVLLFLGAYFASGAFKAFVLAFDLRLGTAIQGWRVAGLGFLALYAQGILPGQFALPAGWGRYCHRRDCPWIVLALARQPVFSDSRLFVI